MANRISREQEQALLTALALGASVENAALKAKTSARSVFRRLADPAFQARLNQARLDTVQRTVGMLTGAALAAVKTLLDLQQDVTAPHSVRRAAARDVLLLGVKYRESADMEQRVAALEQRLADAKQEEHDVQK